jgi:hypothetical protein
MFDYLEPIGFYCWIGSVFAGLVCIVVSRATDCSRLASRGIRFFTVALWTPLIYFGHPAIFAPLWIYLGGTTQGTIVIVCVWGAIFALVEVCVSMVERRLRER